MLPPREGAYTTKMVRSLVKSLTPKLHECGLGGRREYPAAA
jgi:hypothetical protein